MQLPPTVLSMDRNRDKKKMPSEQSKKQPPSGNKKSTRQSTKAANDLKQPTSTNTFKGSREEHENDTQSTDADSGVDVAEEGQSASSSDNNRTKKIRDSVLRPPKTLETTLFDRLEKMYGSAIKRMLEIQYR